MSTPLRGCASAIQDRFIADLFAPKSVRRHLVALHAFDAEIAQIRYAVSEPALGEIRLQWWRDAIAHDQHSGNPLAAALLQTIAALDLPKAAFDALLTARIFDLYNDPMPTMADFEGYAGETASVLVQFAVLALAGGDDPDAADASGHAGVAISLRRALVRFGDDARRRQLFLPRDRFDAGGVDLEDVFAGRPSDGLRQTLADLRGSARVHLEKARAEITSLPKTVRPAFLPLALIQPDLDRLKGTEPFQPPRPIPRWRRQWLIWRAARRGGS